MQFSGKSNSGAKFKDRTQHRSHTHRKGNRLVLACCLSLQKTIFYLVYNCIV